MRSEIRVGVRVTVADYSHKVAALSSGSVPGQVSPDQMAVSGSEFEALCAFF